MTAQSSNGNLPFSLTRPKSPREAEAFCSSLIESMERLLTLIEQETSLVRDGKLKDAGKLQAEKAKLIHEYTRGMMCAKEFSVALGNLSPASAQNLRRQHAEFQPVLRINLAVLATARQVTNDVVSTVAKAVGAKDRSSTYGPTGAAPQAPRPSNGIAINTSL